MAKNGFVLIGYHPVEVVFALKLATDLKHLGVQAWMDRLDIPPDKDWATSLNLAHDECSAFIPILSPDYVMSAYGKAELNRAAKTNKAIIPILLRSVDASDYPADAIGYREGTDFTEWYVADRYHEQLEQVVQLLQQSEVVGISTFQDPENRYLTSLIRDIESTKSTLEHVSLSSFRQQPIIEKTVRPEPVIEESWGLNGPFALLSPSFKFEKIITDLKTTFRQMGRLVLIGSAGSGKTTTLHRLATDILHTYRLDKRDTGMPYYISLADWHDEQSLNQFIFSHWERYFKANPFERFRDGDCILLLDGLDEMGATSAEKAAELRDWLHSKEAPKYIMIACDDNRYSDELDLGLPIVQVAMMRDTQVREFITKNLRGEQTAPQFAHIFAESAVPTTSELDWAFRSPLLLRMMLYIVQNTRNDKVQANTAKLILRWLELRWEREHQLRNPDWVQFPNMMDAAMRLAITMRREGKPNDVSFAYALEQLGDQRLLVAMQGAGILNIHDELVCFWHPMVGDVLAAMAVENEPIHDKLMRPQFDNHHRRVPRQWDNVVIALSGIVDNPSRIVRQVTDVDPYLALRCIGSGNHVSENVQNLSLIRLLAYTSSLPTSIRPTAYNEIENLLRFNTIPRLLDFMRNGSWDIREAATDIIKLAFTPESDQIMDIFHGAGWATGDHLIGDVKANGALAIPALLRLLDEPDAKHRLAAAWACKKLGDRATVIALVRNLNDNNSKVQQEVIEALAATRDKAIVPHLFPLLSDENPNIWVKVARTLQSAGATAIPGLLRLIGEGDEEISKRAIFIIGKIGDSIAASSLLEHLDDASIDVRAAIIKSLGMLRDPNTVSEIAKYLPDTSTPEWTESDETVRDLTIEALTKIGTDEALHAIRDWEVIEETRKRKEEDAQQAEQQAWEDAKTKTIPIQYDKPNQPSAQTLKDRLKSSDLANKDEDEWLAALESDSWQMQRDAAELLGAAMNEEALPHFLQLLADQEHTDNNVRYSVTKALQHYEGEEVIIALGEALFDPDFLVFDGAAASLVQKGTDAIPVLLDALNDNNLDVRGLALGALGKIGDDSVVPHIEEHLNDLRIPEWEDRSIAELARDALVEIGGEEAEEALLALEVPSPPEGLSFENSAESPLNGERTQELLVRQLLEKIHDPEWMIRQDAAKELYLLAREMKGSSNHNIIDMLTHSLLDSDHYVRWQAVEALAWIGDPGVVPMLILNLSDTSWNVRVATVRALGEIGDLSAVPALILRLEDDHEIVREVAADVLGHLGSIEAVPALLIAADDPEVFVRRAVIAALGAIGDQSAIPRVVEALNGNNDQIRWTAVEALGNLKAGEAVSELVKYLDNHYVLPWVEESEDKQRLCDVVATALEKIGTEPAMIAVEEWRNSQIVG